jgi:hypothetical protein
MANKSKADSNDTMKDMLENPIESQTFAQFLSELKKYLGDYLGNSGDLDVLTEQWDYGLLKQRSVGSSGYMIKTYFDHATAARLAGEALGINEMRPDYIVGKHIRIRPNHEWRKLGKLYQLAVCKWLSSLKVNFWGLKDWDTWFQGEVESLKSQPISSAGATTKKRTASCSEDHESSDGVLTRDGSSSVTTTPLTASTAVDVSTCTDDLSSAPLPFNDVSKISVASALTKSTIEPPTTISKASGRAKRTRRR